MSMTRTSASLGTSAGKTGAGDCCAARLNPNRGTTMQSARPCATNEPSFRPPLNGGQMRERRRRDRSTNEPDSGRGSPDASSIHSPCPKGHDGPDDAPLEAAEIVGPAGDPANETTSEHEEGYGRHGACRPWLVEQGPEHPRERYEGPHSSASAFLQLACKRAQVPLKRSSMARTAAIVAAGSCALLRCAASRSSAFESARKAFDCSATYLRNSIGAAATSSTSVGRDASSARMSNRSSL